MVENATDGLNRDTILLGHCLDILPTFPEKSVDIVIADPPGMPGIATSPAQPSVAAEDKAYAQFDQFNRRWLMECRRVLKDSGTLWLLGEHPSICRSVSIMMDLGYWILNDLVLADAAQDGETNGLSAHVSRHILVWAQKLKGQPYVFNHRVMKTLNRGLQMRSDWHLPDGWQGIPQAVFYRIILASTHPGDLILDPFCADGASAAVAKKLHRHWIGIEHDPHMKEKAVVKLHDQVSIDFDERIFGNGAKPSAGRVPFRELVSNGMFLPGQQLKFSAHGETAVIQTDGRLTWGEYTGSIHRIGSNIQRAPCNGWLHWYYEADNGEWLMIDTMRKKYLQERGVGE